MIKRDRCSVFSNCISLVAAILLNSLCLKQNDQSADAQTSAQSTKISANFIFEN